MAFGLFFDGKSRMFIDVSCRCVVCVVWSLSLFGVDGERLASGSPVSTYEMCFCVGD